MNIWMLIKADWTPQITQISHQGVHHCKLDVPNPLLIPEISKKCNFMSVQMQSKNWNVIVQCHLSASSFVLKSLSDLEYLNEGRSSGKTRELPPFLWDLINMTFMLYWRLLNGREHIEPILISLCNTMEISIILTTSQVSWILASWAAVNHEMSWSSMHDKKSTCILN